MFALVEVLVGRLRARFFSKATLKIEAEFLATDVAGSAEPPGQVTDRANGSPSNASARPLPASDPSGSAVSCTPGGPP